MCISQYAFASALFYRWHIKVKVVMEPAPFIKRGVTRWANKARAKVLLDREFGLALSTEDGRLAELGLCPLFAPVIC